MGCVSSKKDYSNAVYQCKERKRLLKLALKRRYAFANAHCEYTLSLLAVAKAIKLLVARLSTPPSTDLIIYPSSPESNEVNDNSTASHQQIRTETNLETSSSQPSNPTVPLSSSAKGKVKQEQEQQTQVGKNQDEGEEEESEGEEEEDDDDVVCEHFYDGVTQPMPMPPFPREVQTGWDFFSPYDRLKAQMENGFAQSYDENFVRMLREEEGIPELEEVEERVMSETKVENACVMVHNFGGVSGVIIGENGNGNATQEETKKVKVIKTPKNRSGVSDEKIRKDVNVTSGEMVDMKVMDTPTDESGASDVKVEDDANVSECENKDLIVIDTATNGRELLEALKDIEDCFVRAYESGLDVSKMLEAKKFQLQTGLEGIKDAEGSSKIFRSITRHRSTSSRSSSCMSNFSSSPRRSSSTWNEFKKEVFDEDYAAMESGSHSLTLSKLYAWEKKLHDDVMAGEETRRLYDRKRIQLREEDAREGPFHGEKTRAQVRALHATISVSIRSAESISERIVKVKDEELYPQLVELLQGLMNTWKIMSELHESQSQIMVQVSSFDGPSYGKFSNKSHRLATLELEAKVREWRACFSEYVSSQKAYLEALDGWISMCFGSEVEDNGSPLLVIVHDWLACLEKLPKEAVICAMKSFGKNIRALYVQQGKEQEQKRKVDGLAKEFDKKVSAFQKVENKVLGSKLYEEVGLDVQDRIEYLAGRKNSLEMFKNRLEEEKAKHFSGIQDTQRITLNGIQTGFSSVFESLVGFSKASVKMYADLLAYNEHAKGTDDNSSNTAQGGGMEDSQQLN